MCTLLSGKKRKIASKISTAMSNTSRTVKIMHHVRYSADFGMPATSPWYSQHGGVVHELFGSARSISMSSETKRVATRLKGVLLVWHKNTLDVSMHKNQ